MERGFSKEVYLDTLKIIPFMWIIVILLVRLVAEPLVGKVMPKFVGQTDGFNARAFWIELLIAQPIARFAMKKLHARQASKAEGVNS